MRQISVLPIWKLLIINFSFLITTLSLPAQTTLQKIENYLQNYQDSVPMPGFSIVIVKGDKVLLQKGYGVERAGFSQKMTPQSAVGIGQITMSMTAMAILQLVEKGTLNLDDKVIQYLPWFRTANKPFSDQITVKMLINHTAGIPAQFESIPSLNEATALEEFVRSMNGYYITKTPGLSYEFSREGFCVAGLLISEVTGMTYSEYVERHIFRPLRMNRTSTDSKKIQQLGALNGHEVGLMECSPAKKNIFDAGYVPSGSEMRSTAEDLGHYLIALLNNGQYGGQQVLSPTNVQQLFTPTTSFSGLGTMVGGNGIDIDYCLGWLKMNIDDRDLFIHTGNTGTMSSLSGINFKNKTAAAILFNADSGRFNRFIYPSIENVGNNILHLLAEEKPTDFARPRIEDPFDEYYDLSSADWDKYIGEYVSIGDAHPIYKDYTIEVFKGASDSLELKGFKESVQKGHFKLQFSSKTRAVLRSIVQPREIQFKMNQNGAITGVFIYGSEFKKKRTDSQPNAPLTGNGMQFSLPPSWKGQWKDKQYIAQSTNHKHTTLKIKSAPISAIDFKQFTKQYLEGQTLLSTGILKKESVRDGVWTEQSFCTTANGATVQHLLVLYQYPLSQQQVQVVLTNPWGKFTPALQDLVQGVQQSLILQEMP